MNTLLSKIKKSYRFVRGLFPSALPVGMTGFEAWADSIQETYKLPTEDKDTVRFALASMIMHLGPQDATKSKYFFVLSLRAGAAKQIAGAYFYEIKQKQQAASKANELKI